MNANTPSRRTWKYGAAFATVAAAALMVGCGSNGAPIRGNPTLHPLTSPPSSADATVAAYVLVVRQVSGTLLSDSGQFDHNCNLSFNLAGCRRFVISDMGVVQQAIAQLNAGHPPASLKSADTKLHQELQLTASDDVDLLAACNTGDSNVAQAAVQKGLSDYFTQVLPAIQAIVPSAGPG
jgi:hypothetical protein